MKYIAQPDGSYAAIDETSELYTALKALPAETRPVFLAESNAAVKAYFAAQAETAKPKEVTMRQARLLDKVMAAIAGMQSPQKEAAEIEWEYSNSLKRSQPLVVQLGAALGLNAAAVDELFLTASKL